MCLKEKNPTTASSNLFWLLSQQPKSPTNANLIYTFQPIFTGLFAWALLGETMGPAGVLGGSIIALAVYIVASANLAEPSRSSLSIDDGIADLGTYQLEQASGNQGNEEAAEEASEEKRALLVSKTTDRE
jgi:hypothetical protein